MAAAPHDEGGLSGMRPRRRLSRERADNAALARMHGIGPSAASADSLRVSTHQNGKISTRSESDGNLLARGSVGRSTSPFLGPFHQERMWEEEGGWRPASKQRRHLYSMERDASMVDLLNVLDPRCLVDQKGGEQSRDPSQTRRSSGQGGASGPVARGEQHSALSTRGIALVGSASALCWYGLRLVLRDLLGGGGTRTPRQVVLELQTLSTLHALGWVAFLAKKMRQDAKELPKYCSRALVASLGFYLHDCWALRSTLLSKPWMLLHQASMATTISSILHSKGVAWLAPFLMSLSVPTLVQELLLLCGTFRLPATRPEVRGLRLLWFLSFLSSKLVLLPLFLRYHQTCPELHQPNLLLGKLSYLITLSMNLKFMMSAARDLPGFLRPKGDVVPAAVAYRVPLQRIEGIGTSIITSGLLVSVFGSYFVAPAGFIGAFLAFRRGAPRFLKLGAWSAVITVILDQVLPFPKQCDKRAPLFLPILSQFCNFFRHKVLPTDNLKEIIKDRDRSYMFTLTPHGFFPWGVIPVMRMLLAEGILPNWVGASVLGALPVAGRLLRFFGYVPATRKAIRECLERPYPRNVTMIVPGGIGEMFNVREDVEISAAAKRKGFMELSKEKGAIVVPVYLFGNSQLYKVAQGTLSDIFRAVSHKLKMSVLPFHGLWGTLLPYPHRLATALGKPVDTKEFKTVEEAHKVWKRNLLDTYESSKGAFGWPDRKLYLEGEGEVPPPLKDPLWEYSALPRMSRL